MESLSLGLLPGPTTIIHRRRIHGQERKSDQEKSVKKTEPAETSVLQVPAKEKTKTGVPEEAEFRRIPIEQIEANLWNPNELDEATFNMLVDNLSQVGMNMTILVTPVRNDSGEVIPNRFRIIDGEQRFRGLQLSGAAAVRCMVKYEITEDEQKFQTMRMNKLRGDINKKKFQAMVESFLKRGWAPTDLAEQMGFVDPTEFQKLIGDVSAGLEGRIKHEFDKVKHEIKTIDDLTLVLNKLFSTYGSSVPYSYMVIDFGGKKHLWLRMMGGDKDFKEFKEKFELCQREGVTVDSVVLSLLRRGMKKTFIDAVRAELTEAFPPEEMDSLNKDLMAALGEIEEVAEE